MPRFCPPFFLLLFALFSFLPVPACAQGQAVESTDSDIGITLSGFLQGRVSYLRTASIDDGPSAQRLGFGLRRIRLRFDVDLGEKVGFFAQLGGSSGNLGVVDIFASYQVTERVQVRLGRMASAQPRAFILTPGTAIDAVDRAAIAERWGARTLSPDGRDFGLDVQLQGERGRVLLFLHNGYGDWGSANLRGGLSSVDPLGGQDHTGLALSLYGDYHPEAFAGLEVGGFAGLNGARSPLTARTAGERGRTYVSYAAHLYWGAVPGSQPVRVKADAIGVRYDAPENGGEAASTLGLSLLGAVRAGQGGEVFGRVASYREDDAFAQVDNLPYWTVGGSFSPSALRGGSYARERFTLAYSTTRPDSPSAGRRHLVILQAQIVF